MMPQFSVNPYRFSADPPAMVAFLETLGMRKVLTASGDWFGLLRAGAGWVAVHPTQDSVTEAPPGETQLVLLTESAAQAAQALAGKGIHATVWDESYGQHAGVVDPAGGGIWINEIQRDRYGYQSHDAEPDPGLMVVGVRVSADRDADREFFSAFGFVSDPGASDFWEGMRSAPNSGMIGMLFTPDEVSYSTSKSPFCDRTSVVRLGFVTTEDLDELAARLTAAGYPAHIETEGARAVHLIDPDGCAMQIHSP